MSAENDIQLHMQRWAHEFVATVHVQLDAGDGARVAHDGPAGPIPSPLPEPVSVLAPAPGPTLECISLTHPTTPPLLLPANESRTARKASQRQDDDDEMVDNEFCPPPSSAREATVVKPHAGTR
ncbi:hypothetical protein B0H11DRAFT_1939360 [Mycena galericulata]|nr:hypothetical protein B0H11DRAFT_1939360 [Mycena galericulata]